MRLISAILTCCGFLCEARADETPVGSLPGERAPSPLPLWPDGAVPQAVAPASGGTVDRAGRITAVSVPALGVYLPPEEKRTGLALIVCPGGGYRSLDWITHVTHAAAALNPKGIAVIGLRYRTCPPIGLPRENVQSVTLLDAQRAVRLVRSRAAGWGIDPHRIGVVGYSAGANLTMNLACHFDPGSPSATDLVERVSCRPDFVAGIATWHWREKESPFTFRQDAPPTFLVHATNDGITGGAPIELPKAIQRQLEALGVPVQLKLFEEGAHGVGNLIPQRVKSGFPGASWPDLLVAWLDGLPGPVAPLPQTP